MGFELPLEGPLHAASFSIDAHKSGKKEKGKCSLHVEYILDAVGLSKIFFPTQNLARAY